MKVEFGVLATCSSEKSKGYLAVGYDKVTLGIALLLTKTSSSAELPP